MPFNSREFRSRLSDEMGVKAVKVTEGMAHSRGFVWITFRLEFTKSSRRQIIIGASRIARTLGATKITDLSDAIRGRGRALISVLYRGRLE